MDRIRGFARDQVFQFSNIVTINIGDGVAEYFAQESHRNLHTLSLRGHCSKQSSRMTVLYSFGWRQKNRLRLNERRFILDLLPVSVSPACAAPIYFTAPSHAHGDNLANTGRQNDTNRYFRSEEKVRLLLSGSTQNNSLHHVFGFIHVTLPKGHRFETV